LGIEVLEEKEIGREERFVTLSPVYVAKAVNGKALDLYPYMLETGRGSALIYIHTGLLNGFNVSCERMVLICVRS
jgi:hypothetical protein